MTREEAIKNLLAYAEKVKWASDGTGLLGGWIETAFAPDYPTAEYEMDEYAKIFHLPVEIIQRGYRYYPRKGSNLELFRAMKERRAYWAGYGDRKREEGWRSAKDEKPKDGQLIAYAHKDGEFYMYGTIYYPEPPLTDQMDYWMPIEEIRED